MHVPKQAGVGKGDRQRNTYLIEAQQAAPWRELLNVQLLLSTWTHEEMGLRNNQVRAAELFNV